MNYNLHDKLGILKSEFYDISSASKMLISFLENFSTQLNPEINSIIDSLKDRLNNLEDKHYQILITGRSQTGKSSVFNLLLKELGSPKLSTIQGSFNMEKADFDDISLIDTPGFDSIEPGARHQLIDLAKMSDLILFIISAQQGNLDKDEFDFIIKLKNVNPYIIFIVNKLDARD